MSPATPHRVNSPKDKSQPNRCITDWQGSILTAPTAAYVPHHLLLTSRYGCKSTQKIAYSPNDLNHTGFYSCNKPHQRSLVGNFEYSLHQTCWVKNLPNRCCCVKLREVSQQPAQGRLAKPCPMHQR